MKDKLELEIDAEDDVWKSGKVVKALAWVLALGLLALVAAVWKDLDLERPWRTGPEPTGPARHQRSAPNPSKKND